MKIGVFGGSFNPIHIGHIKTIKFLIEQKYFDKILLIPCFISPHKTNQVYIDSFHRFEMVKLAFLNTPEIDISDFEINQKEVSYSIYTIKHFLQNYEAIDLVIGYDNLLCFDSWFEYKEILSLVNLLVLRRHSEKAIIPEFLKEFKSKIKFVESPLVNVSSSEIRNNIKTNRDVSDMLCQSVYDYILTNNLYK